MPADEFVESIPFSETRAYVMIILAGREQYRRLYPKVKVQVRRSLSSKIPSQLIDGDLELGVISFEPGASGSILRTEQHASVLN